MAKTRFLQQMLITFGVATVAVSMDIRFPRKNVLSLDTLKNAGSTWYEMYYGGPLVESDLYFNVGWQFTWLSSDTLRLSYSGLYNDVCESGSFPHLTLVKPDIAAFLDGSGHYYVFFSTNPSQYLFLFECWSGAMPESRICPADQTYVTFMVNNQRPDSLPLNSAMNDLKRNTNGALAFDSSISTNSGTPLKMFYTMINEHSC